MFGAIKKLAAKFEALNENKILFEVIDDELVQAQIIDLNQYQLYELGEQADGTPTGSYAPITIAYWKPLAASEGRDGRSDHITGKDTGETYDLMKVNNQPDGFTITNTDPNKFFEREDKGLGLTNESIGKLIPEIKQRTIEKVRQQIFG